MKPRAPPLRGMMLNFSTSPWVEGSRAATAAAGRWTQGGDIGPAGSAAGKGFSSQQRQCEGLGHALWGCPGACQHSPLTCADEGVAHLVPRHNALLLALQQQQAPAQRGHSTAQHSTTGQE